MLTWLTSLVGQLSGRTAKKQYAVSIPRWFLDAMEEMTSLDEETRRALHPDADVPVGAVEIGVVPEAYRHWFLLMRKRIEEGNKNIDAFSADALDQEQEDERWTANLHALLLCDFFWTACTTDIPALTRCPFPVIDSTWRIWATEMTTEEMVDRAMLESVVIKVMPDETDRSDLEKQTADAMLRQHLMRGIRPEDMN